MYVYDIGADRCSTVHRYGHSMNTGIQIYRYGPFTLFFAMAYRLTHTYASFVIAVNISPKDVFSVLYICVYVRV